MWRRGLVSLFLLFLGSLGILGQQSPSFKIEQGVVNAGGHPNGGVVPASGSFSVSLDAVGDGIGGAPLSSPSFTLDPGFVPAYRPPVEVGGLTFDDATTVRWAAEPSAGSYNLYRGLISGLTGLQYGDCAQQQLAMPTAVVTDPVPAGDGFAYLATVENRLDEEGPKGFASDGTPRGGNVCP